MSTSTMKPSRFLLSILALSLGSAAVVTSSASAFVPVAGATSVRLDEASFRAAFKDAMEVGAQAEMQKLIKKQTADAINVVISLCDQNSNNPTDALETEINALRVAWNGAMKTEFVERTYEYYSLMDNSTRKDRYKLVNRYDVATSNYLKATKDKDITVIKSIGADLKGIANGFVQLGDHYYASQAWLFYALSQDVTVRGNDANLREAAIGYENCIAHREKAALKDKSHIESTERLAILVGQGYGKDGDVGKPGADKPGKGKSGLGVSLGPALNVPLTFAVEEEPHAIERPFWANDEVFNAWTNLGFTAIDSTAKFPSLAKVSAQRDTIKSFAVTSSGETSTFVMSGKLTTCQIALGEDKRPWAFAAMTGTQTDTYQGVTINMEPSDVQMTVYIAPASKLTGLIGEIPVEIYDDNMNGVFGDTPLSWGHIGMTPDHFMWDFDAINIDGSKHALPWSRYQKVGDTWYDMAVEGDTLRAAPLEIETGTLKLKFKGPKPKYIILKGRHKLEDCYFDLASNKKGIEVPVGEYELFGGFVSKGKRTAVQKVAVLPGPETPPWTVTAGGSTEVELGGPFGFDFRTEDLGESVKVIGSTVVVTGITGERYERPWNCRPYSMVSVRKSGSKKGGKPEKMKSNIDQDILYSDWALGFHPRDLELPKKKGLGDEFDVQLTEKKNKLFGKVESEWKTGGQ